jgi:hypothetical protein
MVAASLYAGIATTDRLRRADAVCMGSWRPASENSLAQSVRRAKVRAGDFALDNAPASSFNT